MAGYGYVSPYNRTYNDPYRGLNQGGSPLNRADRLEGFDPRDILQSPAYQRLLQMGQSGTGALQEARGTMAPALDYMRGKLAEASPLGTGRGDIVRNQGFGSVSSALEGGTRRIRESATRYGRAADPEAASFGENIMRSRASGAYGQVEGQAQQVELNEREMNERFRAGIAEALKSAGLGLGSLGISDFNSRTNATGQALQSESFARNTAGELLTRILYGGRSGGLPDSLSVEDRALKRRLARRELFGYLPEQDLWNFLFVGSE